MTTILNLYNRDGADLRLVSNEDQSEWHLEVDKEHDYVLEYLRYGYSEAGGNTIIDFIDPSGGPYLYPGYEINDYKIIEIVSPNKLILKQI